MIRVAGARLYVVCLMVLALAAGPALAADDGIVEVENLGSTLVFHPTVDYQQLILTVSGPCDYQYRQVVTDGEPYFRLDNETIDGPYTFMVERIERIDPEVIAALQAARKHDDPTVAKKLCREGRLPSAPITQSSGFSVIRGKIVYDPNAVEDRGLKVQPDGDAQVNAATFAPMSYDTTENKAGFKDFVINDDLIVDGSACIGFDCVNGESFGFDTIRLKENNLRIKFDDTSTISSYPRNDWQLTANDSANGGASKFSIDDISNSRTPFTVEANARSHSLYVDDGGRIGSRTSTPSVEFHTIDGDTPTVRLQQDGSSGFAPQTWDVAGNETNFFIRDVTNGSTLPFRIRPGAPSNSVFIDVDGDVGIGTSSPDDRFEIESSADANFGFRLSRTAVQWVVQLNQSSDGTAPNGLAFTRVGSGVREAQLTQNGDFKITGNYFANGTQLNVPDFVFDPGYELMSLDDLSAFVTTNRHLPDIPSASDIQTTGLNMTDMQLRMLEKIEQLTLYTLQQQAVIDQQQAMIDELRDLNDRVKQLEVSTN